MRPKLLLVAFAFLASSAAYAVDLRGSLGIDDDIGLNLPHRVRTSPFEEKWNGLGSAEVAGQLNGAWQGEDLALQIDAKRAQANRYADRPFQWERFMIKEVTDDDVAFSIGSELFEAVIDGEEMTLAGTSFRGERLLRRR